MLSLSQYVPFVRVAFFNMLAYRLRYVTGIFTYVVFVSIHYFIWQAIFSGKPENTLINGFSLSDMITYITIGWISRSMYFSDIDYDIDQLVRNGQISNYLIRPVNFQLVLFSQALGESVFRIFFFTTPICLVLFCLFPIKGPEGIENFLYFSLATFMSFIILMSLNFIVGLVAFYTKSIQGLIRAKYYIVQLCSGLLLPFTFFPDSIRWLLESLPFKVITYVPLQLYLGKIPANDIPRLFLNQALWCVAMVTLGALFWHRAMSKLTLQGG